MSELRSAAGETVEFEVGPVERDEPSFAIDSTTGAQVKTQEAHGYSAGDHVRVFEHVWNPINGVWTIASVESATEFTLDGAPPSSLGGATGYVARVAAIDLTQANTAIEFVAAEQMDGTAFVRKGSAAPLTGIALNTPASPRKNLATVTIDPADTASVEETTDYYFEVRLTEPDGRVTRLDMGTWKLTAKVGVEPSP